MRRKRAHETMNKFLALPSRSHSQCNKTITTVSDLRSITWMLIMSQIRRWSRNSHWSLRTCTWLLHQHQKNLIQSTQARKKMKCNLSFCRKSSKKIHLRLRIMLKVWMLARTFSSRSKMRRFPLSYLARLLNSLTLRQDHLSFHRRIKIEWLWPVWCTLKRNNSRISLQLGVSTTIVQISHRHPKRKAFHSTSTSRLQSSLRVTQTSFKGSKMAANSL